MTFDSSSEGADARANDNPNTDDAPDHGQAPNHNFLMSAAAAIRERYESAKGASKTTLEDLRQVGDTLNEVKDTLAGTGKGAFGKWCEEQAFPFDPSWRARLMKLAANWQDIMAAVEALPEDKRKWSVDGVMAIWAASKKAAAGSGEGGGEGTGDGEGGGESEPKAKRKSEAEKLREALAEALARVAELEAENASLKGGKAKSKPKDEEAAPGFVSATLKRRATSVWNLYTQGATEGERNAAKSRLDGMAGKIGLDFDAFIKACGLGQ